MKEGFLHIKNPQEWIFPDKDLKLSGSQVHDNIENGTFPEKQFLS